jgi:drug/metabolite transporter (DMT)-like permease
MSNTTNIGVLSALGSAVLFGASTPLAKLLAGAVSPWLLAGLLYLGSGIGLSLVRLLRPGQRAPLGKGEWPWLAGAIASGGVLGPVLLMWGLTRTPGSTAALLLNAEGVLTALLAWFAFRENFDRRIAAGMAAIVAGTVVLSWSGTPDAPASWGPAAVVGACLCWALDNNLTRKVSLSDPLQIAALKGLAAGAVNTALALAVDAQPPSLQAAAAAAVVGFLGYGVSLVLFVVGLRHLGTARAGAYFSAAPFVGALLAVPLLGEPVTVRLALAAALMGVGVWLHLTEHHEHEHGHEAVEHDHVHSHDAHHDHHGDGAVEGEHSHWHRHAPVVHRHPHYPDAHHRHDH